MAEGKKSFLLYADVYHTVKHLTDEQAGQLFKHLLAYVNDENPDTPDPLIKIAFEPIKQQLKRDLKKYESIREKRAKAGRASAKARQQNEQVSTSVGSDKQKPTNPTVNDNVNDNVNVLLNSNKDFDAEGYKDEISKRDNQAWRESWYMKFKTKPNTLSQVIDKFNIHLGLKDQTELPKNLKEYKQHFYNWCNVQERIGKLDEYKKGKKEGAL